MKELMGDIGLIRWLDSKGEDLDVLTRDSSIPLSKEELDRLLANRPSLIELTMFGWMAAQKTGDKQ